MMISVTCYTLHVTQIKFLVGGVKRTMTLFAEIGTKLLTDRVYNELKEAIFRKALAPGAKLDIFELAEQFKVSRTPIKEAFNRLQHEGLIVIKPRKGTFVADVDTRDMIEIIDARLMLELWAAGEAVHTAGEEDIEALVKVHREMGTIYHTKPFQFMDYNMLDIEFHEQIVRMGNNKRILDMYRGLNCHSLTARGYYEVASEFALAGYLQHDNIVKALLERNKEMLLESITTHILEVKKGMIGFFPK